MPGKTVFRPEDQRPRRFDSTELAWLPWLKPLTAEALTDRHWQRLADRSRVRSEFFRLLAHNPEVLTARTRIDRDVFYNSRGGLPRADRELVAVAVSRANGCLFCAAVHARFAIQLSRRDRDIALLLDEGPSSPLTGAWGGLLRSATALTQTPATFTAQVVDDLARSGFDERELVDLILATAFFNWANRLMLSLGEARMTDPNP